MIRIVTDSTCDLSDELLAQHRITVAPINIQFGQESYQENVTIGPEQFYRKVAELNMIPTTSQPSLGQFQAVFRDLAAEPDTDAILCIHITGKLSGTYDSAVVAARQMPPQPPIAIFDSLSGSTGLGFMVLEAAEMAEAGATMTDIVARLAVVRQRMRIFFSLNDLRFARMSGRIGVVQATLASLLNVKPMLAVQEGQLTMLKRVRSRVQGLQALVDALAEALENRSGKLSVIHAQAPDAAEQVRAVLAARLPGSEIVVRELSIGLAVHFGPGTVGVVGYHP
ncbi:MAG: DegV family protein [Chloroflexi bacterium]|nr:DegV family protein [Chloroflexota bacterium]